MIVVSQGVHLDDNKTYPQTIPIALIWPSNKDTLTVCCYYPSSHLIISNVIFLIFTLFLSP